MGEEEETERGPGVRRRPHQRANYLTGRKPHDSTGRENSTSARVMVADNKRSRRGQHTHLTMRQQAGGFNSSSLLIGTPQFAAVVSLPLGFACQPVKRKYGLSFQGGNQRLCVEK